MSFSREERVRVDIVVPVYNKSAVVERAINSVRSQIFTDWNLYLVDDGSTDGWSAEFSDPRIFLVRRENAGPGAARNFGAKLGTAPFIAFLDADDEWKPEFLSSCLSALTGDGALAAVSTGWESSHPSRDSKKLLERFDGLDKVWQLDGQTSNSEFKARVDALHSSAVLIRRIVFEAMGGFYENRITYGEDSYLWMAVAACYPILRIEDQLIYFHHDASTLSIGRDAPYPLPPALTDPTRLLRNTSDRSSFMRPYLRSYASFCLLRAVSEGSVRLPLRYLRQSDGASTILGPLARTVLAVRIVRAWFIHQLRQRGRP